jgi:hypothetical protein
VTLGSVEHRNREALTRFGIALTASTPVLGIDAAAVFVCRGVDDGAGAAGAQPGVAGCRAKAVAGYAPALGGVAFLALRADDLGADAGSGLAVGVLRAGVAVVTGGAIGGDDTADSGLAGPAGTTILRLPLADAGVAGAGLAGVARVAGGAVGVANAAVGGVAVVAGLADFGVGDTGAVVALALDDVQGVFGCRLAWCVVPKGSSHALAGLRVALRRVADLGYAVDRFTGIANPAHAIVEEGAGVAVVAASVVGNRRTGAGGGVAGVAFTAFGFAGFADAGFADVAGGAGIAVVAGRAVVERFPGGGAFVGTAGQAGFGRMMGTRCIGVPAYPATWAADFVAADETRAAFAVGRAGPARCGTRGLCTLGFAAGKAGRDGAGESPGQRAEEPTAGTGSGDFASEVVEALPVHLMTLSGADDRDPCERRDEATHGAAALPGRPYLRRGRCASVR